MQIIYQEPQKSTKCTSGHKEILTFFLFTNRFILMNYEMTERNFLLMHKEAAYQVLAKPTINSSLNTMKLNKVVKKRPVVNVEDEFTPEPEPCTPDTSDRTEIQTKKKRPSPTVKRKKKTSTTPLPAPPQQTLTQDVYMSKMVDIGVQTDEKPPEPEEQEDFNKFHALSMWQRYCVTTIKREDFDD